MLLPNFSSVNGTFRCFTRACAQASRTVVPVWSPRFFSTVLVQPLTCNSPQQNMRSSGLAAQNPSAPNNNCQSIRTVKRNTYRPSALKRIHKHGLESRLTSPSKIGVLWRRILKGRHNLSTFEGFINKMPKKRSKNERVSIFDPKEGFKVKKKDTDKIGYYTFDRP